jgi:hypothetical protein
MADTSPKKKVAAKPKKPAAHPKYSEMVGKAIAALKERGGSSRQAINTTCSIQQIIIISKLKKHKGFKYFNDVYCSKNDLIITLAPNEIGLVYDIS